ncbi:hypothetical protein QBC47DRAFT_333914 [Echria macrotheca]|uniref:Rhodopsin domain-containing protein n=1 Tax=Echria macrotheca TaxID=438768 RepID=A0AAJ0FFM7_9PEZI|nr:hypothetical protein QBC47DRAFT_333914 [Echria macrotheca]
MATTDASCENPTPDFLNEYLGPGLIDISVVALVLTTLVIALRFWVKTYGGAPFGVDDWMIVAAYVFNVGLCIIGILMVKFGGLGYHVCAPQITPTVLRHWYQLLFAFELTYFIAVTLPRLAILWLYLRVFNWNAGGPMRMITLTVLVAVVATGASMFIAACFQCVPIAYWWDRTIPGGHCVDIQTFFDAQSVPGFVLDVIIMILPLRTIWGLRLPTPKRVALVLIFLVASCGVIASIVRTGSFFRHPAMEDETFAGVPLSRYSITESSCYIIANCLAHLRPLVSRFVPPRFKKGFYRAVDAASRRGSAISIARKRASTPAQPRNSNYEGDGGIELQTGNTKSLPVTGTTDSRNVSVSDGLENGSVAREFWGTGTPGKLSTIAEIRTGTNTAASSDIFQGHFVVGPPYTHEIAGGVAGTGVGAGPGPEWNASGRGDCIKVTTEVSQYRDPTRRETFP